MERTLNDHLLRWKTSKNTINQKETRIFKHGEDEHNLLMTILEIVC